MVAVVVVHPEQLVSLAVPAVAVVQTTQRTRSPVALPTMPPTETTVA
jgi:hypothetical protein